MADPAEKLEEVQKSKEAPAAAPKAEAKPEYSRRAIVLEDSTPNRRIMVTLLQKMGFEVVEAQNGKEGLEKLEACLTEKKKIDLFFSDIMMPEMDGFQFLEQLRAKGSLDTIPFVFVTALANKDDIKKAQNLKASGYVLKPIVANQVLKKLVSLFPDLESKAKKLMSA